MSMSLTLGDALLLLIGIAGFILLLYLISLVRNLIITLKSVNSVLADTKIISTSAAKATVEIENIVENAGISIKTLSGNLKNNQNIVSALGSLTNTFLTIKKLFKK